MPLPRRYGTHRCATGQARSGAEGVKPLFDSRTPLMQRCELFALSLHDVRASLLDEPWSTEEGLRPLDLGHHFAELAAQALALLVQVDDTRQGDIECHSPRHH